MSGKKIYTSTPVYVYLIGLLSAGAFFVLGVVLWIMTAMIQRNK